MAFDPSKSILRNEEGDPIPQIWDDEQQEFIPDEGKQIGSIGALDFSVRYKDPISAPESGVNWITVLDKLNVPTIIDFLDWGTRSESSGLLKITTPDIQYGFFHLARGLNGTLDSYTPSRINDGSIDFWKIIVYDAEGVEFSYPRFRFQNDYKLKFPQGVKIELGNSDNENDIVNSVAIRGRELE